MNGIAIEYRPMVATDYEQVAQIYQQGIATGNATFQQNIPTWEDWDESHLKNCRTVGIMDNKIVGWAALTAVSSRCVYAGVAEVSVYVATNYRGLKIGTKLLEYQIEESEASNIWTLQAGIFPENIASIKIHEQLGFRIVGKREKIGKMNGKWRDTLLLERRSVKIGVE
ncbi:MAG: N-acetyltransferase [Saprospiraceae bacterium]|nr:N-acetyltransferase [Saprospiraceae bacterium]